MSNLSRLPPPIYESYEWQERAACASAEADRFFVPEDVCAAERARRERTAKALCARCPVVAQCLTHALKVKEPDGVWGGLSAPERRRLLAHAYAG